MVTIEHGAGGLGLFRDRVSSVPCRDWLGRLLKGSNPECSYGAAARGSATRERYVRCLQECNIKADETAAEWRGSFLRPDARLRLLDKAGPRSRTRDRHVVAD